MSGPSRGARPLPTFGAPQLKADISKETNISATATNVTPNTATHALTAAPGSTRSSSGVFASPQGPDGTGAGAMPLQSAAMNLDAAPRSTPLLSSPGISSPPLSSPPQSSPGISSPPLPSPPLPSPPSAHFSANSMNATHTTTASQRLLGQGVEEVGEGLPDSAPQLEPLLDTPADVAGKGSVFGRRSVLGPRPPRCQLRVWGMQGRGLRSADSNGLSDPYVCLRVGREQWSTRVIYKTLNPIWDEPGDQHTFGAPGGVLRAEEFEREDVLYVKLMDKDTFGDDDLGESSIFFGDMFPTEPPMPDPMTGICPPQSKGKALWSSVYYQGRPAGEIFLCMEAIGHRPLPDGASLTLVGAASLPSSTLTDLLLSSVIQPPNCLKITIHGARNLKPRGIGKDSCNAYVRIDVAELTARTQVVNSTLAPTWGEGWAFPVVERASMIALEVNHSRMLGPPVFQGRTALYLATFDARRGQAVRGWYTLLGKEGIQDKMRGELDVEVCWEFRPLFAQYQARSAQGGPNKVTLEPLHLAPDGEPVVPEALSIKLATVSLSDVSPNADQATISNKAQSSGDWGEVEIPESTTGTAAASESGHEGRQSRLESLAQLELKDGDWQVQVHVIEARQLKAENFNNTSDPVVYVSVGGHTQHTSIHKNVTSCVFDQYMFFSFPKLTKAEVEALTVDVSVFDANVIAPKELIGKFVFDPVDVYYQPHHCYNKRWVGLVDPSNGKDRGLQGYLRLSVSVLGPGDKLYIPDDTSADAIDVSSVPDTAPVQKGKMSSLGWKGKKKATMAVTQKADGELADADDEVTASALVLLPPSIRRETRWLVIGCHAADGLPAMDDDSALGLYSAGIDAYAQVQFAGNPVARTQWITCLGKGNLSVEWNRELWLPFNYPNFTNRIELAVFDFDRLKENDRVGTVVLSCKDLEKGPLPLAWWPIYGAPNTVYFGAFKNRMNRLPSFASTYRGKILLSARMETAADNKGKDEVHWKPAARIPRELMPPLAVYRLRALIIAGDELPLVSDGVGKLLGAADLGVTIAVAGKQLDTPRVKVVGGQARWNALVECDIPLPLGAGGLSLGSASPAPLPDTFIYLYKGDPVKSATRISYARLDTASLITRGLAGSTPYWQPLQEDIAINAINDDDSAGSILLRIGVGPIGEAITTDWREDLRELEMRKPYEMRVHVFQARNLPAADSNGLLDPFLKVSIAGDKRLTSKRFATAAPAWYETICVDVMLPSLRFAPQLHVEVWDYDDFSNNDFVAELRYDLASPETLISSAHNLPTELPRPRWYSLSRSETKVTNNSFAQSTCGEILLLVQLVAKDSSNQVVPMIPNSITPNFKEMYLDIVALGCRNLSPYAFLPISYPHMEFTVGSGSSTMARKRKVTDALRTVKSRYPSGTNPNFCERILVPIQIPDDPLFAPSITVMTFDNRLGGFDIPTVGTTTIHLERKIPWCDSFCASRGRFCTQAANPFRSEEDAPMVDGPADKLSNQAAPQEASSSTSAASHVFLGTGGMGKASTGSSRPAERAVSASSHTESVPGGTGLLSKLLGRSSDVGESSQREPLVVDLVEEEYKRSFSIDLTRFLHCRDAAEHVDDVDQRKYLRDRREYSSGLEDVFQTSPFEAYKLYRGQQFGRGVLARNDKAVGTFKGLVRLCASKDEPNPIDMSALLSPRTYVVRLYVLSGHRIQPKDSNGKSDCYLIVRLGDTVIKRRSDFIPETTEPEFYQSFEFRTTLPGPSSMNIEVWDYDAFTSDDFIGSTTIDLEDRWFEPAWRELGASFETPTRFRPKPIERRDIWAPKAETAQGQIRMWVDILSPEEAVRYPLIQITPPKPKGYEVRMVVWKARGMQNADALTGMNDLYIKAFIEGMRPQSTDVHLRAKRGKGSWNWRMKWTVSLPRKYFYLTLQAWDQDIVKYNDCIGEAKFDLGPMIRRCLRNPNKGVHVFSSDDAVLAEKASRLRAQEARDRQQLKKIGSDTEKATAQRQVQLQQSMVRAGIATPEMAAQAVCPPDSSAYATFAGGSIYRGVTAGGEDSIGAGKEGHEVQSFSAMARSGITGGLASTAMFVQGRLFGGEDDKSTGASSHSAGLSTVPVASDRVVSSLFGVNANVLAGMRSATEAGDAQATLKALKKAAGIEMDVHPEHGQWLELFTTQHGAEGDKNRKVGEVLVSIELLPVAIASKYPAGLGRSNPNQHPTLPPPMGRIRCSLNPCYLLSECFGPRLCTLCACALCCMVIALAVFFGAPFINTLVTWLQLLPKAAAAPLGVLIGLLVCAPPLFCYCRFVCCPPRAETGEAILVGSASDQSEVTPDGIAETDDVVLEMDSEDDMHKAGDKLPLLKRSTSATVSQHPLAAGVGVRRSHTTRPAGKARPSTKRE